jgi:hypothetical protein
MSGTDGLTESCPSAVEDVHDAAALIEGDARLVHVGSLGVLDGVGATSRKAVGATSRKEEEEEEAPSLRVDGHGFQGGVGTRRARPPLAAGRGRNRLRRRTTRRGPGRAPTVDGVRSGSRVVHRYTYRVVPLRAVVRLPLAMLAIALTFLRIACVS